MNCTGSLCYNVFDFIIDHRIINNILDTIHIMVSKRLSLQSHSDQVTYNFNILATMTVTVQCKRHEQFLSWTSQLQQNKMK